MSCALKDGLTKELSQSLNDLCNSLQEDNDLFVNEIFNNNEIANGLTLIYGLSPCLECPKFLSADSDIETDDCILEKLGLLVSSGNNLDMHKHNRNLSIVLGTILKLAKKSVKLYSDTMHMSEELQEEDKRLGIDKDYFESAKQNFYRNSERSSSNFAERREFYMGWQDKPEGTRAEIADKLGCSKRTVQRDLKKLRTFEKSFADYLSTEADDCEDLSDDFYKRMGVDINSK